MMIESITLERERDTTDRSGGERCRIRSTNSLTEHRKPEQRDKLRRKKYALQRNKNNKHCILRRTASENTKCLLGTPQAPK